MRAVLVITTVLFGFTAQAAEVEVTVEGVNEVKGTLLIGFFTNTEDFRENEIDTLEDKEHPDRVPTTLVENWDAEGWIHHPGIQNG